MPGLPGIREDPTDERSSAEKFPTSERTSIRKLRARISEGKFVHSVGRSGGSGRAFGHLLSDW